MRVYLPATIGMLRRLVSDGELQPLGGTGFALTPALRESYVSGDTEEAEEAVRSAAAVIDAADLGDLDAEFALGEAEDHELAWYAPQELPFLLELL